MTVKDDDVRSEILKEMFGEIMRMIREKQIKIESIMQTMIDQERIPQDTYNRICRMLTEYGKKKQWV